MIDLGQVEKAHFAGLVGETFTVAGKPMRLAALEDGPPTPAKFREPFSLIFECDEDAGVRSEVVPVEHEAIGSLTVLVTRIVSGGPPTYQVVFN